MEKIGIVTSARELNYGALLQAYALQCVLCAKGFDARLLWWANQKVSRRDVRLRKLFAIAWKFICNPSIIRKSISSVLVSSFFFTAKIGRFYINNDSTGLILPGGTFVPVMGGTFNPLPSSTACTDCTPLP